MSTTVLSPNASRTPRGLLPETDRRFVRDRTGPDLDERPSLFQYVTKPGDCCGEIDRFLLLRRRLSIDRSLVAKVLNASGFRRACSMAISRNGRSILDFPEYAQAVRYGVHGTPC